MATAMAFPLKEEKGRGKKSILNIDFSRDYLVKARYVLRNNPPASNSEYPQYALDVMAGRMTLTEAYDATPGQKAMATAMAFPDDFKRGRKKSGIIVDSSNNFDRSTLSRARTVLRNNPPASNSPFPQSRYPALRGVVEAGGGEARRQSKLSGGHPPESFYPHRSGQGRRTE